MSEAELYETTIRPSKTEKLKAPNVTEHAIYFTIVDGEDHPEAFFINSKEVKSMSFALMTALMTSYSARLSEGADIHTIIDAMKETFEPDGDYIIPDGSGRKVHSLVHHLGLILEAHVEENNERRKR